MIQRIAKFFFKRRLMKTMSAAEADEVIRGLSEPETQRYEKTSERMREVMWLLNFLEPDPCAREEMIDDDMALTDALDLPEEQISAKLRGHFGAEFASDVTRPIWLLIDDIKSKHPQWLSSQSR